jgi:hypothetical protein
MAEKFDLTKGQGATGGKAAPFDQFAQKNPQKSMQQERGVELGSASGQPAGGTTPFGDIAKSGSVNPVRATEQGAGTLGNSQMPFRVNGGGKK